MSESNAQPQSSEEKVMAIRSAVDFDIVGENIQDMANFAIEKHEFRNATTLSPEVREEAVAKVKEELWQFVEELKLRHKKALETMFNLADKAVDESSARSKTRCRPRLTPVSGLPRGP